MKLFPYCPRPEEASDSTLKMMFEELQNMVSRLGDKIEEQCGGLESRVTQSEQRAKERFVSLEMARGEVEHVHAKLEK
jgi:hypothetical protein